MSNPIRKAVIPAAGLGTRFLPASKVIPKELLTVGDRPSIQHVVEDLAEAGCEEFIIVISKGKEAILEHFQAHPQLENFLRAKGKTDLLALVEATAKFGKVRAVYQEEAKGLGHAVLCARQAVGDEPFLVALADDLVDAKPSCARQMVDLFKQHGKPLVAVQEVPDSEVNKYGIVAPRHAPNDPQYSLDVEKRVLPLADLVEKPNAAQAPSRLAIVGRYLLTPDLFPILEKTGKGAGGEIQLTDGLKVLNQTRPMLAYRFHGQRFDAGDKLGFLQANLHYGLRNREFEAIARREIEGHTKGMKS